MRSDEGSLFWKIVNINNDFNKVYFFDKDYVQVFAIKPFDVETMIEEKDIAAATKDIAPVNVSLSDINIVFDDSDTDESSLNQKVYLWALETKLKQSVQLNQVWLYSYNNIIHNNNTFCIFFEIGCYF